MTGVQTCALPICQLRAQALDQRDRAEVVDRDDELRVHPGEAAHTRGGHQPVQHLGQSLYAGDGISVRQHTLVRLALTHITKTLHEIATFVYLAGGTTSLRRGTIQRMYRDVHAGTQHVTSSPNVWQTCGRELMGVAEGKTWQFLDLVDPH